ncbi:CPBP family intramembrane glutamic endopeptidase [Lacisediminihabitans sp. H27-G8]|uniref:CPBP family intramembrane glutamic endopeptidase n=1 Tax=Lacisediminihabitans sp. H27-G8 TaxID=3111909 RepID=UPI0038FC9123
MSTPPLSDSTNFDPVDVPSRRRIRGEIVLVLGLSLGASAVYSIVSLADSLTRPTPLSQQVQSLNNSLNTRAIFDFIYQFLAIFFDLVPVALVCFLLWQTARPHLARLGLAFDRPGRDSLLGLGLALLIGIPGIFVYLGGKALGIGVTVSASPLDTYWWTIPILVLSALRAGLQEELIVIGYLFARLRDLGWKTWPIILSAALLRGTYHLYQGFGAFVGNFAMGALFGWLYSRYGRVLPLVIAHFVIDTAIFVGYPWAASAFPGLFGVAK